MNQLKYLEFQKLMKELQFVESDFQYQSEVMRLFDIEFFKSVDIILDQFPQLKEIYNKKQEEQLKNIIKDQISEITEANDFVESTKLDLPEVKKLYRDIAKVTHPDKIQNHKLNELYLEATEAYESNDLVTLYKVCTELKIDFELPEDFISKVKTKINSYRQQVSYFENTYTYKWMNSNDRERNKIVVDFIRERVS